MVTHFLLGRSAGCKDKEEQKSLTLEQSDLFVRPMEVCCLTSFQGASLFLQTVGNISSSEIAHFIFNISSVHFLQLKRPGNLFTRAQWGAALNSSSPHCGV